MATKTVIVDDLDGTEGAETIRFGLGSERYEIDLADGNAEKLRTALSAYVSNARVVGHTPGARNGSPGSGGAPAASPTAIREWARANGHQVGSKGRIPTPVQQAYDQAHG